MTEKEFTTKWISMLEKGLLKTFPDDFIKGYKCEKRSLPPINLHLGEELFGSYEILDAKGNSTLMAGSFIEAKYLIYSNRMKPEEIKIPKDEDNLKESVKAYEKHLDGIIRQMEADYKKEVPQSKNFIAVSNDIFNLLNLKRH